MQHTFLLVDLAGYSAMTEAHGDAAAADASAALYEAVRMLLRTFGGREVKSMGDALLVRFDDAAQALQMAVRIIDELGDRHGDLGLCAGLHTGTAVERGGDYFGATVNLTARLTDAAQPGEILLTEAVLRAAGPAVPGALLRSLGRRRFKNIGEPVAVHALARAFAALRPLTVDPVCRMAVDPEQAPEHRTHRGVTYALCSARCAATFDRDPGRFTEGRGPGGPPWRAWPPWRRRSRG